MSRTALHVGLLGVGVWCPRTHVLGKCGKTGADMEYLGTRLLRLDGTGSVRTREDVRGLPGWRESTCVTHRDGLAHLWDSKTSPQTSAIPVIAVSGSLEADFGRGQGQEHADLVLSRPMTRFSC